MIKSNLLTRQNFQMMIQSIGLVYDNTVSVYLLQRLGVQFTEYHSESMYHHQSLELVENLRKQGLVSVDE